MISHFVRARSVFLSLPAVNSMIAGSGLMPFSQSFIWLIIRESLNAYFPWRYFVLSLVFPCDYKKYYLPLRYTKDKHKDSLRIIFIPDIITSSDWLRQ